MLEYRKIAIDFDVYKALTARLETPESTENDVLRDILGLDKIEKPDESKSDWKYKEVVLKAGTKLQARFKGRPITADIRNGRIFVSGEYSNSPTEAARVITGGHRNGWTFWEYQNPSTGKWHSLDTLRQPNN